jgi:hypothetical protein
MLGPTAWEGRRMVYKFKSPATADLLMLGPQGDQLLRLLGREPAPRGIFEAADLPALVLALEAAVAADEARRAAPAASDTAGEVAEAGDTMAAEAAVVSLRQRAWPLRTLFQRAAAAGHAVVWGV